MYYKNFSGIHRIVYCIVWYCIVPSFGLRNALEEKNISGLKQKPWLFHLIK